MRGVYASQMKVQLGYGNHRSYHSHYNRTASLTKLQTELTHAIDHAMKTCEVEDTNLACVIAWDQVEELTKATRKQQDMTRSKDVLEEYCETKPSDLECRMYDI